MARFTKTDLISEKNFSAVPVSEVPPITLYGLHRYAFSGAFPQYTPVPCPAFSGELARNHRHAFLDALFRDTVLAPDTVVPPYKADGSPRSEETRRNGFDSLFLHHSTVGVADFLKKPPAITNEVLEQVAKNIRTLIPDSHPCWEWMPGLARDLLTYLSPDQEEDIRRCLPEKGLALLAVASIFLGPENAPGSFPLARFIREWLAAPKPAPDGKRNPGLYTDTSISPDLLPPIRMEQTGRTYERVAQSSPLLQLISSNPDRKHFLLFGREKTAVSGAGKTSALKYLCSENKKLRTLYLPLAQIYSPRAVRSGTPLEQYLRRTLHVEPEFTSENTILLLDGLDEVSHAVLTLLCEDLDWLTEQEARVILSSRKPLEELHAFDSHLSHWSSLWQRFTPCVILPMTEKQRRPAGALSDQMDTPFLLSLLRQAQTTPAPATDEMVARWGARELFAGQPANPAELFYAFLTAHTVRNFEICKGRERQGEADAFLLFRTLPAIAFRQLMEDLHDGNFHPAVRDGGPMDRTAFEKMMSLSLAACRKGLPHLPGYRDFPQLPLLLRGLEQDLNYDTYAAGSVSGLFLCVRSEQDDPFDPWREEFCFLSQSHRDYFAALHVANIFLLARADAIPDRHELPPFLGCTLEFLPPAFLRNVADFVELMLPEGEKLGDILNGVPPVVNGQLAQMLTGQIGGHLCPYAEGVTDRNGSSALWLHFACYYFYNLTREKDALRPRSFALNPAVTEAVRKHYLLSYAEALAALNRLYRQSGKLDRAEACAWTVCRLQAENDVPLSDGQHLQALVYWSQLSDIYNGRSDPYFSFPRHFIFDRQDVTLFPWLSTPPEAGPDLLTPAKDMLAALESLAAGGSGAPVFPAAGPETAQLAPGFIKILRSALRSCEQDPVGTDRIRLVSLRAKMCSIYAACAPGASGMALNLLASFLERDMEVFEHDPRLPLFQKCPELWTDGTHLTYGEDRWVDAYRTYRRIADIRRGRQPWSARGAAALLMRDQVRLDENGRPVPGECNPARVYTKQEAELLDRLTRQGLAGRPAITYEYWRIRFLHDTGRRKEAVSLLEQAWKEHRCFDRLSGKDANGIDLVTAQLTAEVLGLELYTEYDWSLYFHNLSRFFRTEFGTPRTERLFTTGGHRLPCALEDAVRRIRHMGQRSNSGLMGGYFIPEAPATTATE